jgi:hypothetical protein
MTFGSLATLPALLLSLSIACGGASERDGSPDSSGAGGAQSAGKGGGANAGNAAASGTGAAPGGAGSGSGASSANGGSSGAVAGNAAGGASARCPDGAVPMPLLCYDDCYVPIPEFVDVQCHDGQYVCPTGYTPAWECEPNACALDFQTTCCDTSSGRTSSPECGADGRILPCADEQLDSGAHCVPEGYEADDCWELDGTECHEVNLSCSDGNRCGTRCSCSTHEDGSLRWNCGVLLC